MPNVPQNKEEFSRIVAVRKIPANGLTMTVEATPEECAALTKRLGILSCEALAAEVRLTSVDSGRRVKGKGRMTGRAIQACVVTLAPVVQDIDEPLDLLFLDEELFAEAAGMVELDVDPEEEEVPDPIVNGTFDLGAVVAENFALALDPYPRSEGADYAPAAEDEDEPESEAKPVNPFAILRVLQGGGGSKTGGNET